MAVRDTVTPANGNSATVAAFDNSFAYFMTAKCMVQIGKIFVVPLVPEQ